MLARLFDGSPIIAYQASTHTLCGSCHKDIPQGAYYTRHGGYGCCRECYPFWPVSTFWKDETVTVAAVTVFQKEATRPKSSFSEWVRKIKNVRRKLVNASRV